MKWATREIDGEWFAVATDDKLTHAQAWEAANGSGRAPYSGRVVGPFESEGDAQINADTANDAQAQD